jgi:hypothetical protein
MKTRSGALYTAENGSRSVKHENWTVSPSVPSKMSPGAQNLKIGSDDLGTADNRSRSAKLENRTRHPRYRRSWVQERKT